MPSLPELSGWKVVAVFESLGWRSIRQTDSHFIMSKARQPATLAIPNHQEVAQGTLRGIIHAAGLSAAGFIAAL